MSKFIVVIYLLTFFFHNNPDKSHILVLILMYILNSIQMTNTRSISNICVYTCITNLVRFKSSINTMCKYLKAL